MNRIALLTLTAAFAACGAEEPGRLPVSSEPVDVIVSAAERAPVMETFSARIVSERTAEVATRMSGSVSVVHVEVGSTVRAGEPLVSLDATDVDARVSAAQAGFELAQRSFQRIENLAANGAASAQELDQAQAALSAARSSMIDAQAQGAYAVVRAPFDGVVTHRSVDAGDLAGPGSPLVTLVAPGALKLVADLPADRFGVVTVGDTITFEATGSNAPSTAVITQAVPALGGTSRTFRVQARLAPGSDVLPGAYARVRLARPDVGSTWIPTDAVIVRGQLTGILTVEDNTLRLRWVRLGQTRDHAVEMLSGPSGTVTLVRRPPADLTDGGTVRNVQYEDWSATSEVER